MKLYKNNATGAVVNLVSFSGLDVWLNKVQAKPTNEPTKRFKINYHDFVRCFTKVKP